jgi:hypothetical protein
MGEGDDGQVMLDKRSLRTIADAAFHTVQAEAHGMKGPHTFRRSEVDQCSIFVPYRVHGTSRTGSVSRNHPIRPCLG